MCLDTLSQALRVSEQASGLQGKGGGGGRGGQAKDLRLNREPGHRLPLILTRRLPSLQATRAFPIYSVTS